jgi:diaminohydroxyphosphoribosylaminopyrimidine deaminase/5-amino-6-(5-phosphoribosylamino)uracil reductase
MSDRKNLFSELDGRFMKRALELAQMGLGYVSPNPAVGAVLVKNGKIIGEGCHKRAGLAHAEVEALKGVSEKAAKGATMYVTLEPCSHENKRTPPCTKFLISKGIKRLVAAVRDPNKYVNGEGLRQLARAGVIAQEGLLSEEAAKLNEVFFYSITRARPFVVLKMAISIDGKVATANGDSKWISNDGSRKYSHQLRSTYDAIMTSSATVLNDDPHLGAGIPPGRDPLRIIVDRSLKTKLKAKVYRDKKVLVITTTLASKTKISGFKKAGIDVTIYPSIFSLKMLLKDLYKRGITSVMIESGGIFGSAFIREGLVNKCLFFIAPKLIGADGIPSIRNLGIARVAKAPKLTNVSHRLFGEDVLIEGYL